MFDIVNCKADPKQFGFDKFFSIDSANTKNNQIIRVANVIDSVKLKNKKVLIMLDDYAFDEGAIKLIAEKKQACFLIDVSRIINSSGVSRAILISKLRTFLRMCNKFGAFYTFATFSKDELKVRTSDELIDITMLLGINKGQARFALKILSHYLA